MKKVAAGLLLWNERMGAADLKAVFEAPATAEVNLKGWRIENAMVCDDGL